MLIVYEDNGGPGWDPITYMVHLCAELFDAELMVLKEPTSIGMLQRLLALFTRQRGLETCLVVSKAPWDLLIILQVQNWRRRFGQIAAWVIDGFWTDAIPRNLRYGGIFDQIFITTDEDVDVWREKTRCPITSIPWGSDVLRLGTSERDRAVDILRVGRQPPEWDNDLATSAAARARGLTFHGRPKVLSDPIENMQMVMERYGNTKFLLAFSNTAHNTPNAHPTHAYLTGRWSDGLAAGAIIAGVAPESPTANRLLWPGATLDLGGVTRDEGLEILAAAVASWRPGQAAVNNHFALERFDWRWRFHAIAVALSERPSRLAIELNQVERIIAGNSALTV